MKKIIYSLSFTMLLVFIPFKNIFAEGSTDILKENLPQLVGDSSLISVMILLLVLTLIPTVLLLMTSYTRVLIVLSFTRNALGTQQMPPNQVLIGIALVLTFFIMTPVVTEIKEVAYDPYINEEINIIEALDLAEEPMKQFMYKEAITEPESLNMFLSLSGVEDTPETVEEINLSVLIPAFVTSELTKAFKIGFMIYLPFIMIDMIVASILMSMGMMMLPPAMISLPFKILLFVLVDGWELIMKTIILSFG